MEIENMRKLTYFLTLAAIVLSFSAIFVNGQTPTPPITKTEPEKAPAAADYTLVIENEDGKQTKLGAAELGKLKRQSVKAGSDGKELAFEGFALVDVLKLGGVEFGETLRGKRLATFLLVEAADDYQAVFALPELDPAFNEKVVLLTDKRDGQAISKAEGPLRLVVPGEKKAGRWVRQVTVLKILRATAPSK